MVVNPAQDDLPKARFAWLGAIWGRRYFLVGYPKDGCNVDTWRLKLCIHFLTENGWYQLDVYWEFSIGYQMCIDWIQKAHPVRLLMVQKSRTTCHLG